MNHGHGARPHAQRDEQPAVVCLQPAQEQIQRGQHGEPTGQQRPLRQQQIDHAVHPAHIFLRVVGGRVIIAKQRLLEQRGILKDLIKRIQKAQAAAQEQQEEGQQHSAFASGEFPGEEAKAPIHQGHHQRARQRERKREIAAQLIHGGRERVHQKGIAQHHAWQNRVFRGKARAIQPRGDAQVQAQIAIGGLAHIERAIRAGAQHVRILQIRRKQRERDHQRANQPRGRRGRTGIAQIRPAPQAQRGDERRHAQAAKLRGGREAQREGEQRGQPHHQNESQAQAQPRADGARAARKQAARDG